MTGALLSVFPADLTEFFTSGYRSDSDRLTRVTGKSAYNRNFIELSGRIMFSPFINAFLSTEKPSAFMILTTAKGK